MTPGHLSRKEIESQTFLSFGSDRLGRLCRATGLADDEAQIVETFGRISRPWSGLRIGPRPRWYPSILSDDHAPFELGAAFSDAETEVQWYWEAQPEAPSLASNMALGLATLDELVERYGLSLERWNTVRDLFFPDRPWGLFTILFGVTCGRGRAPAFKVYVNPYVRGPSAMPSLMHEAMARLGFGRAWDADVARRARRDASLDEIMYLCLDLSTNPQARVKVYRRHYQATVAQIGELAGIALDYEPGDAERFYGLAAGGPGPFAAKPPITSLTFRQGDGDRPCSMTLEFPISSYVRDDREASERVARCFAGYGLDPSRYARAIAAVATRPLEHGNGIHSHVTFRRVRGAPRLTVYFATEAYGVEALEWSDRPEALPLPVAPRAVRPHAEPLETDRACAQPPAAGTPA